MRGLSLVWFTTQLWVIPVTCRCNWWLFICLLYLNLQKERESSMRLYPGKHCSKLNALMLNVRCICAYFRTWRYCLHFVAEIAANNFNTTRYQKGECTFRLALLCVFTSAVADCHNVSVKAATTAHKTHFKVGQIVQVNPKTNTFPWCKVTALSVWILFIYVSFYFQGLVSVLNFYQGSWQIDFFKALSIVYIAKCRSRHCNMIKMKILPENVEMWLSETNSEKTNRSIWSNFMIQWSTNQKSKQRVFMGVFSFVLFVRGGFFLSPSCYSLHSLSCYVPLWGLDVR